jgi:hypothetical protein
MKKLSLVLALMVVTLFGGLLIEGVSAAQNSNSSTTMGPYQDRRDNMRRRHRRHRRRHRRHERRGRRRMGNANM